MPDKKTTALGLTAFILLSAMSVFAQSAEQTAKVPMAEGLRSSGKIYVVVAVLLTVVAGMLLYMVRLDKKISKLEKRSH